MQMDTRHERILDLLMRRGYAGIEELVVTFEVTPQTIRRDLKDLADRGLLRRHHGGASVMASTANTPYEGRHVEHGSEKGRIAAAVAKLLAPGSSIFMTPGTTVEAAAQAIADLDLPGLRVITNNTVVAQILGRNGAISIELTGGSFRPNNQSLWGPAAAEAADKYRCDVLITSCGAIDPDGWLLEFNEGEVVVAKTMLANARRRILLADHSKFSRVATCKLARIGDMTTVVTDQSPTPAMLRLIREGRCELIIA